MTETTRINVARLLLSGLVAGFVLFAITGVMNAVILSAELKSWMQGVGGLLHPPAPAASMGLWALMSLITGLVGVWIYVGVRPRYGAGPKTALLAGGSLWIACKLAVALDLIALGLMPMRIVEGQLFGGLVAVVAGVFVGAWLYKE